MRKRNLVLVGCVAGLFALVLLLVLIWGDAGKTRADSLPDRRGHDLQSVPQETVLVAEVQGRGWRTNVSTKDNPPAGTIVLHGGIQGGHVAAETRADLFRQLSNLGFHPTATSKRGRFEVRLMNPGDLNRLDGVQLQVGEVEFHCRLRPGVNKEAERFVGEPIVDIMPVEFVYAVSDAADMREDPVYEFRLPFPGLTKGMCWGRSAPEIPSGGDGRIRWFAKDEVSESVRFCAKASASAWDILPVLGATGPYHFGAFEGGSLTLRFLWKKPLSGLAFRCLDSSGLTVYFGQGKTSFQDYSMECAVHELKPGPYTVQLVPLTKPDLVLMEEHPLVVANTNLDVEFCAVDPNSERLPVFIDFKGPGAALLLDDTLKCQLIVKAIGEEALWNGALPVHFCAIAPGGRLVTRQSNGGFRYRIARGLVRGEYEIQVPGCGKALIEVNDSHASDHEFIVPDLAIVGLFAFRDGDSVPLKFFNGNSIPEHGRFVRLTSHPTELEGGYFFRAPIGRVRLSIQPPGEDFRSKKFDINQTHTELRWDLGQLIVFDVFFITGGSPVRVTLEGTRVRDGDNRDLVVPPVRSLSGLGFDLNELNSAGFQFTFDEEVFRSAGKATVRLPEATFVDCDQETNRAYLFELTEEQAGSRITLDRDSLPLGGW